MAQPTAAPSREPGKCDSASCSGGRYDVAFEVKVMDLAQMLVAVCAAFDDEDEDDAAGGADEYGEIL